MNRTAIIQKHQTLMDIALQYCGSAEALFALIDLNGLSLTEEVAPGTQLLLPDIETPGVVQFLSRGGHKPATGIYNPEDHLEGIGYWAIQRDFEVQ